MQDTYIKSYGINKTLIQTPSEKHYNEINWNGDYDGKKASLALSTNNDGLKEFYDFELSNDDLIRLFDNPQINRPIDKRLEDLLQPTQISLKSNKKSPLKLKYYKSKTPKTRKTTKIYKTYKENQIQPIQETYLLSPELGEEFIVPIPIGQKSSIKRKNKKQSHISHKFYSKPKSSSIKQKKEKKYTRTFRTK